MFCPKCGEKNKDDANFCVSCGEKFGIKAVKSKSGKSTKNTKDAKEKADDVKEMTKEVTKEMSNKVSDIVKDMIAKPVDALKIHGDEKNFNLALVLVAIMSVLVGLLVIALIKNVYSSVIGLMSGMFGSLYPMGSSMNASVPYFKYFFIATISGFALSFVFVGVLYLVNNVMFKGKESFKRMYVIYSVISLVVSCSLAISIILSFVSISLGMIILSLGLTLSAFYVYQMIRIIGPKDENLHGYIYVLTSGIFYLVTYILVKLFM